MLHVDATTDGAAFGVRVQPGARTDEIVGVHGDLVKVRVAAPPERGRANAAVVALLSERLGVSRTAVTIAAGTSSRTKRVRVVGVSAAAVQAALG